MTEWALLYRDTTCIHWRTVKDPGVCPDWAPGVESWPVGTQLADRVCHLVC